MTETTDALLLDLVEWIAREPRLYSEVIETWRTSCPRLTIWEDAVDRGYVARRPAAGGVRVAITESGQVPARARPRRREEPAAAGLRSVSLKQSDSQNRNDGNDAREI
jgi:hypothetical protein